MPDLILKHHRKFIEKFYQDLPSTNNFEIPSEYIERVRYLDKELTPIPGYYKFDNTPYWKEPLDMLSSSSNIQKVVIVKGVQIGFSTGVLENIIAYSIGSDPKPILFVTSDKELAKLSMEIKVEKMIDSCGLRDRIYSQTKQKSKKSGDTIYQKQYQGGFLVSIGARNPGKLRSMSFPIIVMDELDSYPDHLKGEGDPVSLADNRTNAYGDKRKILYGSTPLILQTSKIWKLYLTGDQRQFKVPCKFCGEMQVLKWHGVKESGYIYGIVFEVEKGLPIYETVGYKCINEKCGKIMKNHDKSLIFELGKWEATAKTQEPGLASYQLSALYSNPSMFSWEKMVEKWHNAWNLEKNIMKDKEKYREFRNLMQGLPFEEKGGESIRYERSVLHRRPFYIKNQIPNQHIINECGSPILLLTASIDVQKNNLFIHIIGWTAGGRNWTIDFFSMDGPIEDYNSPIWKMLDEYIMNKKWLSDDGKEYGIINTFIDSGHYTQYIYAFCKQYSSGVFAVKGEEKITGGVTYRNFNKETLEKEGLNAAFHINTTKIKDHISVMLNKLQWDSDQLQPDWYPNFPDNLHDDFFRMFEAENKIEERDRITNKWIRTRWVQKHGADNHAFDTFCYSLAGIEVFADYICRNEDYLDLKMLDWDLFWEFAKQGHFYKINDK